MASFLIHSLWQMELSMMISAMLTDAYQDGDNGILIRYRFDEKLFNLRGLQAKS